MLRPLLAVERDFAVARFCRCQPLVEQFERLGGCSEDMIRRAEDRKASAPRTKVAEDWLRRVGNLNPEPGLSAWRVGLHCFFAWLQRFGYRPFSLLHGGFFALTLAVRQWPGVICSRLKLAG